MKKWLLIALCFIMILSCTSCDDRVENKSVGFFAWAYTSDDYFLHYEARGRIGNTFYSPLLEDGSQILAGYTDINYSYQHTYFLFSNKQESYSIILFAEYSSETYEERKSTILSSYPFLEETDISYDGKKYESLPAEFIYEGYNCKAYNYSAKTGDKDGFVGFNDEKCRIAFCSYKIISFGEYTYGKTKLSENEMAAEFIDDFFYWNDKK